MVQWCPIQPSLEEFENLLANEETLAKKLASVFLKNEEKELYNKNGRSHHKN